MLNLLFPFKMFVNINSDIFKKIFLFNVVDFILLTRLFGVLIIIKFVFFILIDSLIA